MIISKSNFNSVLIFSLIIFSSFIFVTGCTNGKKKDEVVQKPLKMAVVNVEKVIKNHSDWNNLEKLDKKLSDISNEMQKGSGESLHKLGASQAKKMDDAQKKARAELEAELRAVQASLDAQKKQMEAQFERDLEAAKNAAKNINRSAPPSQSAAVLTGDMLVLRDRQVSAKRLALQKQAKENIERKKTTHDNELFAYAQQISKENQSQRLNIQLKLQLDLPEEEKKALQEELMAINEEEAKLKNAKKTEISSQLESLSAREFKAVEDGVAAYKKQLDSDIRNQVGYGSPSKEEASQLQAKANEIQRNLAQKQKDMEAKMASAGAEASRRLNEKKAQIEKRLENLGVSLNKEMEKSREALIKSDMEKVERLKSDYSSLMSERKNLYDAMLEDVKVAVKKVTEDENIDVVFLTYISNVSVEDVTDKTISALKKE